MGWAKRLTWGAVVLGTLGSGLWVIGAEATRRVSEAWLEERRASGWQVSYASLETGGYPLRFETRATDLLLSDPAAGWAWNLPDFTLIQPLTRLNSVEVVLPQTQSLASPFENWEIEASTMRGSGAINPLAEFALLDGTLEVSDLTIRPSDGGAVSLAAGSVDIEFLDTTEAGDELYGLSFAVDTLVPSDAVRRVLDPAGVLPQAIESARIEAELSFDRPWDLPALEGQRPQPRSLQIDEARADWGDLAFRTAGSLVIDADGIPEGRLTIRAENWRRMLDLAENAGQLPPDIRRVIETPLALIGGASGAPEDIDAPLIFRNGRMIFGPFPLGPAPRIMLR